MTPKKKLINWSDIPTGAKIVFLSYVSLVRPDLVKWEYDHKRKKYYPTS